MKKKTIKMKTKPVGKEFKRFENLLGQIVKVPKEEIEKREKEYQKKKEQKNLKKTC